MSRKFFSLIHSDDKIHLAPEQRVIAADAFSDLLAADEMISRVQGDAEQYKKALVSECEKLKEQSEREGFAAGFETWAAHIAELEQETRSIHKELRKVVIPLALKAAKKIVGREIELSEDTAVDIVANSLKAVAQHKKIVIYANKQDLETLEASKPRLKGLFEQLETLSIRERDDIEPGGCVIETEAGIINAQLSNQWLILEKAFIALMKTTAEDTADD